MINSAVYELRCGNRASLNRRRHLTGKRVRNGRRVSARMVFKKITKRDKPEVLAAAEREYGALRVDA